MIKKTLYFIGWFASSFLFLMAIVGLLTPERVISIPILIWGLLFFPPLYYKVTSRYGRKVNALGRIIGFILAPITISPILPASQKNSSPPVASSPQVKDSKASSSPILLNPSSKSKSSALKLNAEIDGNDLLLSVDADKLPDDTKITVWVSREYWVKGTADAYAEDYLKEETTLGKWRSSRRISLSAKEFTAKLRKAQDDFSRMLQPAAISRISDQIVAELWVSEIGKPGSKKIAENKINYPLTGSAEIVAKAPPSYNYENLDNGVGYILERDTPLMPEHSPKTEEDILAAIDQVKTIAAGGKFVISDRWQDKASLWYKVKAYSPSGSIIGEGWINSIALMSQKLSMR
jgi:hypothetical protein